MAPDVGGHVESYEWIQNYGSKSDMYRAEVTGYFVSAHGRNGAATTTRSTKESIILERFRERSGTPNGR